MNEIIKVNYENETQTVSARELHERLVEIDDFKEFFIEVSKLKVCMEKDELKTLRTVVNKFVLKFGSEAIVYLMDMIDSEMILPCKSLEIRKNVESEMKKQIADNFNEIFPKYSFVCCEKNVDGIGRIDIYALYGKRSVIIELKTGNKNPNLQLISYGSKFQNPILIGITEQKIEEKRRNEKIIYYTFEELKKKAKQWIV